MDTMTEWGSLASLGQRSDPSPHGVIKLFLQPHRLSFPSFREYPSSMPRVLQYSLMLYTVMIYSQDGYIHDETESLVLC